MSHRFNCCVACSSKGNIQELAFYFTITLHLTATQVKLSSLLIPTVMSDSQSLKTLLLEGMIWLKIQCFYIRDLNNLTFQIIFDACRDDMNVGLKHLT
jgi:hypothetical protein